MNRTRTQMVFAFFACVVFSAGSAWGQANFYEGKTLTVMIGAKSGSLEIARTTDGPRRDDQGGREDGLAGGDALGLEHDDLLGAGVGEQVLAQGVGGEPVLGEGDGARPDRAAGVAEHAGGGQPLEGDRARLRLKLDARDVRLVGVDADLKHGVLENDGGNGDDSHD